MFKPKCSAWIFFILSWALSSRYLPVIIALSFLFNARIVGRVGSYEVNLRAEVNFWPKIIFQEEKHKAQMSVWVFVQL